MLLKYIEGSLRDITIGFDANIIFYLKGCYEICLEEMLELELVIDFLDVGDALYEDSNADYIRLNKAVRFYNDNIERKKDQHANY